jgi:transcriptional regulator with XRE-family HTH domain
MEPKDFVRAVAGRLRALRDATGLSQRQLAERAGMQICEVSRIETLARSPTLHTLSRLAGGLGLRLEDMLNTDEDPKLTVLLGRLRRATPEQQHQALQRVLAEVNRAK